MVNLSDYRASIRNLIEAENMTEAFAKEGFDGKTAEIVTGSKAFRASRSVSRDKPDGDK